MRPSWCPKKAVKSLLKSTGYVHLPHPDCSHAATRSLKEYSRCFGLSLKTLNSLIPLRDSLNGISLCFFLWKYNNTVWLLMGSVNVFCFLDFLQRQRSSSSLWEKVTAHRRTVSETPGPGPRKEHTRNLSRDPQRAQSCHRQHLREARGWSRQVEGLRQQVVLKLFP